MKTEIETIKNILMTDPDRIVLNGLRDIKHYKFDAELLFDMSKGNIITFVKRTLDEIIVYQLENQTGKYWK